MFCGGNAAPVISVDLPDTLPLMLFAQPVCPAADYRMKTYVHRYLMAIELAVSAEAAEVRR